ncbi:MAG TPA: shikimate dehydrogenase [Saprospiraceae bacterium]|nr:shikimate dehydrogenase [Saprospiraceae bacterium]
MKFGLIGYPLTHSFSAAYFEEKFQSLRLKDFSYQNFPVKEIDEIFPILQSDVFGFNVTIPYKSAIISYLNDIDLTALQIGAVNTLVRIGKHSWKGFNTDVAGFSLSLQGWLKDQPFPERALILGTGGAAKAIKYALTSLGIHSSFVSRDDHQDYSYPGLTKEVMEKHLLIVNATPLGTFPETETCPNIPYEFLTENHMLFDLVYNPTNTLFLTRGAQMGAQTKNGLDMLHLQAEQAWIIWKSYGRF